MDLAAFSGWNGIPFLAALIMGIVQVIKWNWTSVTKGQKGLLAVAWGLLLGAYLSVSLSLNWHEQMFYGFVAGLAAAGSYKIGKKLLEWRPKAG